MNRITAIFVALVFAVQAVGAAGICCCDAPKVEQAAGEQFAGDTVHDCCAGHDAATNVGPSTDTEQDNHERCPDCRCGFNELLTTLSTTAEAPRTVYSSTPTFIAVSVAEAPRDIAPKSAAPRVIPPPWVGAYASWHQVWRC